MYSYIDFLTQKALVKSVVNRFSSHLTFASYSSLVHRVLTSGLHCELETMAQEGQHRITFSLCGVFVNAFHNFKQSSSI